MKNYNKYESYAFFLIGLILGACIISVINLKFPLDIKSDRLLKPYKVETENKQGEIYRTYYYKNN